VISLPASLRDHGARGTRTLDQYVTAIDARGNDCIVLASGEANCSCDSDPAAGRP
jgi:hypothetical protein